MGLRGVVGRKWKLFAFALGMTLLLVLLDYLNPFVDFYKTWNMHYVINHQVGFLVFLIPIFFFLGVISEWEVISESEDMSELFFACVLIPVYYYILKGFVFLFLIAQDPNLPHVIGAWYGGYILDWRDFTIIYYFSLPLSMLLVWRYCFGFMVLGYITSHIFGRSIRNLARTALSRISDRFGQGPGKELVV
ncbi:MAG: hypothetical protein KAR39_00140 [Thermoplasmata archaeon]|nr:hypothetical protein [Thermoplasmata archaeon]